ncbi:MAG TPA: hypothetical protein VIJ59_01160 [Caulobacteraceae bacterium]
MSDYDPNQPSVTEVRTTVDPLGPTTEVKRTEVRANSAAWWAVGLVGIVLIAAVTYVITRPADTTNSQAAIAAATQQAQTQAATQAAQSAAAQAQSAAQGAAQGAGAATQAAADRARMQSTPAPQPAAPADTSTQDQGGGSSGSQPQQ